jgi:SNF2 family DNA or RNA helicase
MQAAHLKSSNPEDIVSLDGKQLFHFQCEGVRFLEHSGGRAALLDEMGLGKTVQALAFLLMHEECLPFLWIGKSSLKYQYQHEIMRWMGEDSFAQVLNTGRDRLFPGCTGYIVSYDLLRNLKGEYALKEQAAKLNVKTIVLDECQQIKNSQSTRTIFTKELCKDIPNVIALSGTPIKNHAAEFFPVLNILKPMIYNNESRFIFNECDSYWNGYTYKTGGLANPKAFHEKTKSFLIRREREEVMPDLPKIQRTFSFHEMGKIVEQAYIKEFKEFRDAYNSTTSHDFEEASNILAYLSRMRHIVGLSKIDPCIDHVMEFLGSTERKLTIFVHHKDVAEILASKLASVLKELELEAPLSLTAELDPHQRFDMVEKFRTLPKKRILIASTLASGEGLNLQFCQDCIILERQWNPANEEQAEGRFPRPGSIASSISSTYFVAVGTVDEFFSELVERKREIFTNTMSKNGAALSWDQSSLMRELAEILASQGGKKWSI